VDAAGVDRASVAKEPAALTGGVFLWSDGFCRTVRRNLGGCALTARGVMRTVRITSKGTEDNSTDSPFADVL
jgi:hypothetical protein